MKTDLVLKSLQLHRKASQTTSQGTFIHLAHLIRQVTQSDTGCSKRWRHFYHVETLITAWLTDGHSNCQLFLVYSGLFLHYKNKTDWFADVSVANQLTSHRWGWCVLCCELSPVISEQPCFTECLSHPSHVSVGYHDNRSRTWVESRVSWTNWYRTWSCSTPAPTT